MRIASRPLLHLFWVIIASLITAPYALSVPTASPDIMSTLRSVRATRIQSVLDGNAGPLVAPCTESTRLMTEGLPTVIGTANIDAYYRALFARFTVAAYTREHVQVWNLAPRVAEFGRFTLKLTPKEGGQELTLHGKYLDLWHSDPRGGLRLVVTAWNFDSALPDSNVFRLDSVPSVRMALQPRVPLDSDLNVELAAYGLLMQQALIEHNAALWSRFYADDAVLLPNNAPIAMGHAAIRSYLEAHSRELPTFDALDMRNDRIETVGQYIYEFASHTAHWRNGADSGVSTGKNLRIWRRDPDRGLKMILQMSAYD